MCYIDKFGLNHECRQYAENIARDYQEGDVSSFVGNTIRQFTTNVPDAPTAFWDRVEVLALSIINGLEKFRSDMTSHEKRSAIIDDTFADALAFNGKAVRGVFA